MTVIAITGVGPQGVVHWSSWFVRVPVVRVDSTVAWLIGFRGGQLVQTRSGSLSLGGMWMVLPSGSAQDGIIRAQVFHYEKQYLLGYWTCLDREGDVLD